MFLLSRRQRRAALTGAAAACAYLAAAELGSRRPVRVGGLFLLSAAGLAGMMTAGASPASVKARSVEARLNQFLTSGGQVGGDLVIHGNHTVNGTHTVNGRSNLQTINDNSGWVPAGNGISMSGTTLWLNGGTLFMQAGQIQTGGGDIIDKQGVKLQFP